MNPALPEPDRLSPELGDWRAAKAFWVTAFDGVPIPEPVAGHQVSVHHEPGGSHTFTTPSATALHLSAAWKSAGVAARHQASIVWKRGQLSPGQMGTSVGIEGVPVLFDFFEALMVTAMSSFAAVEAFCNGVIVDQAPGPLKVKRRKGVEHLAAEEVERIVSTDEKLKRVVPDLLGVPTPAGKGLWEAYLRLKSLRDAVTHFKRHDQAQRADRLHEPTILLQSYRTDPFSLPETAVGLIGHFYTPNAMPRWLMNPEWRRSATP